ncbi:uncharacterized protein Nmag_0253 [Natrialba magadii ATCC 43099]|uniref:Uncharacterized protein n=1 Tax=Natrialba magadii (strain ATCC 43099 / DSM 3394 / CCM 3739 / CIP 104546 / IAM 13178 / JCM 8861 / NBRC 102185 / NCIMB 2190 / MS3) TaxID=547559 RepID=D3SX25_NATMM|nr:uncharacterized protein Nmag_0253 [Natrialba magadii ATCC 43099]
MPTEPKYDLDTVLTPDSDSDTRHRIDQRLQNVDTDEVWYTIVINDSEPRLVPESHYEEWTTV